MHDSPERFPRFKRGVDRLIHIALAAGMGWVLVMMMLTTVDVAGRYFFSRPVPGAIEMSEIMLAVFGILGMAYTHHAGANIRVTMFTRLLPPRLSGLAGCLTTGLSLLVMALLAWYASVYGIEELHAGTTTDTLGIPLFPLYFLLCAGAGLVCLALAAEFAACARTLLTGHTEETCR